MEKKMETAIVHGFYIGENGKENGNCYSILGLYPWPLAGNIFPVQDPAGCQPTASKVNSGFRVYLESLVTNNNGLL